MITRNIRNVIENYIRSDHTQITHGIWLDDDERHRRRVIQGLLYDGLEASEAVGFPEEFTALAEEGLIRTVADRITLTPRGVRHADIVGNLFFSPRVRTLIEEYEYDT